MRPHQHYREGEDYYHNCDSQIGSPIAFVRHSPGNRCRGRSGHAHQSKQARYLAAVMIRRIRQEEDQRCPECAERSEEHRTDECRLAQHRFRLDQLQQRSLQFDVGMIRLTTHTR